MDKTWEVCLLDKPTCTLCKQLYPNRPDSLTKETKMKTLYKRNQLMLALAGMLLIALITAVGCASVNGSELSGAVSYPYISPASATINVGATVALKVNGNPALGTTPKCTFTSPSSVVTLGGAKADQIVVTGVRAGSATVTATCDVGTRTAQVTVNTPPTPTLTPTAVPPTATPTLPPMTLSPTDPHTAVGGYFQMTVLNPRGTCNLTGSSGPITPMNGTTGNPLGFRGDAAGTASIRINCGGTTLETTATIGAAITPRHPTIGAGAPLSLGVRDYTGVCNNWVTNAPNAVLTRTSDTSATFTSSQRGQWTVGVTCDRYIDQSVTVQ